MQFADGKDLSQKIERPKHQSFNEKEVMHYFIQIGLALKYIHDRKILHKDLKGQNIFLMKYNMVKLRDF
jgi:NIMA (never in mitosis gene a)-related kinase